MRLILLAGIAVTVSIAVQFTDVAYVTGVARADVPSDRAVSPNGHRQLKWFLSNPGDRVLPHDATSGSRLVKLSELDLLTQITVIDYDVHRFGVHVGGRDLTGAVATLEKADPGSSRAATPWVTVVRQSGASVERQVLAVDERRISEGFTADDRLALKVNSRRVRVQREYAFTSPTENIRIVPTADGSKLTIISHLGAGTFGSEGLVLGEIIGFWATSDRLTVITTAQVRYEFDMVAFEGQLKFKPSPRAMFADAVQFLQVQTSEAKALVTRRAATACGSDLAE